MDLIKIKQVVDLMKKSDLSEFEIQDQDFKLRIKRDLPGRAPIAAPAAPVAAAPAPVAAAPAAPAGSSTRARARTHIGTGQRQRQRHRREALRCEASRLYIYSNSGYSAC